MKKILILSLLLAAMTTATALAYDFEVDNVYYKILTDSTVEVTYNNGNDNSYSGQVHIPETVTNDGVVYTVDRIGSSAFYKNYNLTAVELPNTITRIDADAFYDCRDLRSVTIPNSVTYIGNRAFYYCMRLSSIEIPNSVTYIGNGAFYDCHITGILTIPNSVTYIGTNAFSRTSRDLTGIVVAEGNPNYDSRDGCNALIQTSTNLLMLGCKNTIIPNTVTTIGAFAFWGSDLTNLDLPNSVTEIRESAFGYCYELTSVSLGNSLNYIGKDAFQFCSFTSIEIPDAIISIDDGAFSGCHELKEVVIGESISFMGESVFEECGNVENFTCKAVSPPWCDFLGLINNGTEGYPLYGNISLVAGYSEYIPAILRVPEASVDLYYQVQGWSRFITITSLDGELAATDPPFVYAESQYGTPGTLRIDITGTDNAEPTVYEIRFDDYYDRLTASGPCIISCDGSSLNYINQVHVNAISRGKGRSETTYCGINKVEQVVRPIIYAQGIDEQRGLMIHWTADEDYAYSFFHEIQFTSAQYYYYKINDSDSWERINRDSHIYLPDYGDYTIMSYGFSEYGSNSETVITYIHYDESGYTSECGQYIVHNDLSFSLKNNSTASVRGYYSELPNPTSPPEFTIPYSGDIEIPTSIVIRGQEYSVTGIDRYAFSRPDNGITSILIPNTITQIMDNPFTMCSQIKRLTVADGNPVYDSRDNCNAIIVTATNTLLAGCENTVIPQDIEVIGNGAFTLCAVTDVDIPATVQSIGSNAFASCTQLNSVTVHSTTPPENGNNNVFGEFMWFSDGETSTYERATLFVPNEALEAYQAHDEWGKFTHIVPFIGAGPGDINGDGNISISDVTGLVDLLLSGGELPAWMDVNGDGNVSIKDITDLIDKLLAGGL